MTPRKVQNPQPPRVLCWLCQKPIKGKVYYQAGVRDFPSHKGCLARPALTGA